MCLLNVGFSTLTDGNIAYWAMENTSDSSGNGNTLIEEGGITHTTGIIDNGYNFDGSNDYINTKINNFNSNQITINYWFKSSSTSQQAVTGTDGGNRIEIFHNLGNTEGKFRLYLKNGGNILIKKYVTISNTNDNNWHLLTTVFDTDNTDNTKLYLDGVEYGLTNDGTQTNGNIPTLDYSLLIGAYHGSSISNYFTGQVDEFSIYNRILTEAEISELYNDGNGLNPYINIAQTPIINYTIQDWYNNSTININLTTETNTNMSYILDNQNEILICENCNQTTLQLTNLSEGTHSILFESADENGIVNTTANFTIDTIKPIINNNIQTEYNDYTINLNSSCQDDNLLYCNISLNNQTIVLNSSNFTSTLNGNISYVINAEDKAGNKINQTGTIFVNPYQYVTFKELNGTIIDNYFINNISYSGTYKFKLYNYNLGENTLKFVKDGYVITDFTLILDTTSKINKTIEIPKAEITFYFRDILTKNLIKSNLTLQLSGKSYADLSSNNGSITINDNMLRGDYIALIIDPTNKYESKEVYFTFDGLSKLNMTSYFLELNGNDTGYVIIHGSNFDGSDLRYKRVFATQLDTTKKEYILVQEGKTDSEGNAEIKVVMEKAFYIFCIELDDGNICTEPARIKITENGKTIQLNKNTAITSTKTIYDQIYLSLKTFNYNSTTKILDVNTLISNKGQIEGKLCYKIIKINDLDVRTELNPECVNLNNINFGKTYLFESNSTYEWYGYIIDSNNLTYPFFKRIINEDKNFFETLKELSLKWIFLILIGIIGISSLFYVDNIIVVLFINAGVVISLWTYFSDIISPESSSFIFVVILITAWVIRE